MNASAATGAAGHAASDEAASDAAKLANNTIAMNTSNEFDEFDDNDDEFASFDMEAAISSASPRAENAHPNMSSETTAKRTSEYEQASVEKRLKTPESSIDDMNQSQDDSPSLDFQEISPQFQSSLENSLMQHFGHNSFREGQLEIIHAVLHNRDACAFWATGAGKSLTYQLPPLHLNQVSVIVTPLVSLMMDQVAKLNSRGVAATYLGASQKDGSVEGRVFTGEFRLVYVTPEKLVGGTFLERLGRMHLGGGRGRVCVFAVDERLVLFVCWVV